MLMEPVLPDSMRQLRHQLTISDTLSWDDITDHMIQSKTKIEAGEVLFTKVEDHQIEAQIKKLEDRATASEQKNLFPPVKDNIPFDDFLNMDLRVGEIISFERIPKSSKLLTLHVDLGIEQRTIVSGIAKHVDESALVGQKVCVIANLAPKKLMGVESKGMILMAEDSEGKLRFVDTKAENGSTIS